AALHELLKDERIEVDTSARITRVEGKSGESVRLEANRNGSETVLEGTHLLAATGRTPNTDGIGLGQAGVETTDGGYVKVNERLETTAPDVWAVVDVMAARISPKLPLMTSASCAIISWAAIACTPDGRGRFACSPTPRSPTMVLATRG